MTALLMTILKILFKFLDFMFLKLPEIGLSVNIYKSLRCDIGKFDIKYGKQGLTIMGCQIKR